MARTAEDPQGRATLFHMAEVLPPRQSHLPQAAVSPRRRELLFVLSCCPRL